MFILYCKLYIYVQCVETFYFVVKASVAAHQGGDQTILLSWHGSSSQLVDQSPVHRLIFCLLSRSPGTKVCFVVSLWGVLFLSWVGLTLASASPYILEHEDAQRKVELASSVFGAAAMYLVCACLSGFCWYKTSCVPGRIPTMEDADES